MSIIKNTSSKIINIGATVLLPDATMSASDVVCGTPAVKTLEKMGMLSISKETKAPKGKPAAKTPEAKIVPDEGKAAETTDAAAKEGESAEGDKEQ